MTKKPNVDGFIPRRSNHAIGGGLQARKDLVHPNTSGLKRRDKTEGHLRANDGNQGLQQTAHGVTRETDAPTGVRRADVDSSLREIDAEAATDRDAPRKRKERPVHRKRIAKMVLLLCVIGVIVAGGWLVTKALLNSSAIFKGDIFGLIQNKQLRQDEKGRTNVLVVGTSEDDPGHPAGNLTDSIMVISIDQKNKNAYMVSIPRDLEVKYGMACPAGYAGKINAYFSCVDDGEDAAAEDKRQMAMRTLVGEILGMEVQYSAHVNYTVMRDVVNAIGPITVDIQGSGGAPGVMDSNFDWKCKGGNAYASLATMKKNCPPNGHFIDYPNGPAVLDAEHALYLAQARGDIEPTYGLGNSNFDREQNQQKIVMAIREKALSSGTLTNISKVSNLMDAIGHNLKTNFETSEIRTLMALGQDIPASSIQSINFLDDNVMNGDGQPAAGMYNYTQIKAYIQKKLYATGLSKEDAHVTVLNASGVAGAAQQEANRLTALGLTVDLVGNAPKGDLTATTVYQVDPNGKQPLTLAKLNSLYATTAKVPTELPFAVPETTDFVIVVVTTATSVETDNNSN